MSWLRTLRPDMFDELAQTREMLNSRYDDLKSGRVKPIAARNFLKAFAAVKKNCSKKCHPMIAEQGIDLIHSRQDIPTSGNLSRR